MKRGGGQRVTRGLVRIGRAAAAVGRLPVHPLLFAAAWVLSAFVDASPSPYSAIRALGIAMVIASVLIVLARLLLRSWARGGIVATGLVVVICLGRDVSLVVANTIQALPAWKSLVLATLAALAVVSATLVLRRRWRRQDVAIRGGSYLNLLAALLCGLIVVSGILRGSFDLRDLRQGGGLSSVSRGSQPRAGPDIYVIVLDGYPRADTLLDSYGFDNAPFLDALRARGFWVDPASHTNYSLTELAFTSLFHMSLLEDIPELQPVLDGVVAAQPTGRRVLNDNRAFAYLRSKGYTVVANSIPYAAPAMRQADVYVELGGLTEFERHLVASTFLLELADVFDRDALADDLRNQVTAELGEIPIVAADVELGPRFVFAHVLAPHTPFLFDASGNPITSGLPHRHEDRVSPEELTEDEFGSLEVDEIRYLNAAVLAAIDAVLRTSVEPPVIILTSDEGVRAAPIDPAVMTPTDVRDVFGNLFVAYTPGRTVFSPGTTPSRVMAQLFNAYFDAGIPLASTATFVGRGTDPYHLIQVPEPAAPDS